MDKGVLTAGISTVFLAFSIVIGATAAKIIHPLILITLSSILSIMFLFFLSKIFKEKIELRKLFSYKKDLFSLVISRSLIGTFLLIIGFSMVAAVRVVFLVRLEPILVFIISVVILKEKIKVRKVGLLLLLLFGALVFTTDGSFDVLTTITPGDLIVVLALLFLAYSYIPSSKLSKRMNPITLTIGTNILPVFVFLPLTLIFIPNQIFLDTNSIYLVLAYTITFYVLGLFLWFKSLKNVKPWVVASILSLEPIAGAVLAFLWLEQTLSFVQLLGAAIMVVTTFFISKQQTV